MQKPHWTPHILGEVYYAVMNWPRPPLKVGDWWVGWLVGWLVILTEFYFIIFDIIGSGQNGTHNP